MDDSRGLPKDLEPEWRGAFAWLERELDGKLVSAARQPRWRAAWVLEFERAGETLPLYWRGDRGLSEGINDVYDLAREEAILRVLEANGIPVPHIYTVCPDPHGIVMEYRPGLPNLADAADDRERESVMDHYLEILVAIHSIAPAEFEASGLQRPPAGSVALGDLDLWESIYRKAKRQPEPLIEFVLKWVRGHTPDREKLAFVLGDAGQLLFEAGRVSAVLDVEFGHLGDPIADLAGLRAREIFEPLGDLSRAVRRYCELAGEDVDPELLWWHTARFALYTPLSIAHVVADPDPGVDWAQYRAFFLGQARLALQGMAESMKVVLPGLDAPIPAPTSRSAAHQVLVAGLREQRDAGETPVAAYEAERMLRVAEYLERSESLGPYFESQERGDLRALLGHPAEPGAATNAELEVLVANAGPDRDEELLRYFQRRTLREHEVFRPAMREMEDKQAQPIRFRS
jgi:aminoglycoside phosphotransferase (APT) family kinase protein